MSSGKTVVSGGDRVREFLDRAGRGGVTRIEIGWVRTAKYPRRHTGRGGGNRKPRKRTPPTAAMVAAWNEWGTRRFGRQHSPPRPFIRPAIIGLRAEMRSILKAYVDPKQMLITRQVGDLIGMAGQTAIRRQIDRMRRPPNRPSTIKLKGSSKPLVDTGFMRQAVIWRIK